MDFLVGRLREVGARAKRSGAPPGLYRGNRVLVRSGVASHDKWHGFIVQTVCLGARGVRPDQRHERPRAPAHGEQYGRSARFMLRSAVKQRQPNCQEAVVMILQIALLAATVLVALTAANAVRHLVQWPTRRDVSAVPIVRVQRTMRRNGLLLGTIEAGALVALLIALFRVPPGSAEMWLIGLAALCVAGMMGIWAAWLRPLNITISKWLPEALPPDWSHHHARWSTFHRVRVILAIIAIALLLMGLFARPAG